MATRASIANLGTAMRGVTSGIAAAIEKKKEIEAQLAAIEQFKQFNEQRKSIGLGTPPVIPPNAGAGVGLPPLPMVMNQDMGAPNLQDPATVARMALWGSQNPQQGAVLNNFLGVQKVADDLSNRKLQGFSETDTIFDEKGNLVRVGRQKPATYHPPFKREKFKPDGTPVTRKIGQVTMQVYDLVDPNTGEVVGTTSEKLDDEGLKIASIERVMPDILNRFNSDPNIRKSQSMIDFSDTIKNAVLSGNPIAHAAVPTLMARASGEVGNLSEADKAPFGGSRDILERLEAIFNTAATGELTPDNREYVSRLANTFMESANKHKKMIAKERAKQNARAYKHLGITEKDILDVLVPEDVPPENPPVGNEQLPPLSSFERK